MFTVMLNISKGSWEGKGGTQGAGSSVCRCQPSTKKISTVDVHFIFTTAKQRSWWHWGTSETFQMAHCGFNSCAYYCSHHNAGALPQFQLWHSLFQYAHGWELSSMVDSSVPPLKYPSVLSINFSVHQDRWDDWRWKLPAQQKPWCKNTERRQALKRIKCSVPRTHQRTSKKEQQNSICKICKVELCY